MTVRLTHLVKSFEDAAGRTVRAVDDVSLELHAGELVTLLGPSGCGKTTTLRMIAGFETPTAGAISVDGKDLTRVPAHARDTPMVFQSYALFPHLSVRENALFGLDMRGLDRGAARAKVEALAGTMGLTELLDRSPHQLSGGQQQRVALLRGLVTEPKVLLFDEPLSNLDARLRVELRAEIRRIQRRAGITAVYVTHDREEAMVLSDRIVVMERGRIAQVGTPREVYTRPASAFVATFLGDASFFPATLVARDGERAEVESPLFGRLFATAPAHLTAGAAVLLVVRPEALRLRPPGAAGPEATVKLAAYLGAEHHYELDAGGQAVVARLPAVGPDFPEGARVHLAVEGPVHALGR